MPAERSTGKASGRVSSVAKSSKSATASTGSSKKAAKAGAIDSSAKAASGPPLQENSEIWSEAAREAKRARGGKDMIHGEGLTKVDAILQAFDNTYDYGPSLGMTRLERWQRADAMGLDPPVAVRDILLTGPAQTKKRLQQSVYENRGI